MGRFNDPHYHAGSVEHFHFNLIEPIPGVEFRAPLAKLEPSHAKNYARMSEFILKLRELGGFDWLFSPEGIAETLPKLKTA